MSILGNPRELATVLAALRYWQREGLMSAGHEQDVATDGGTLQPLSADEIDTLCEELNTAALPAVVIEIEGGMVNCVRTSVPARVVVLDEDTEGADADRLQAVNGTEVFVHDYTLTEFGGQGLDGVDPDFVAGTLRQIDEA